MKFFFAFMTLAGVTATGCQFMGDKAHCGFYAGVIKPPYVDTSMPVLVNPTMPAMAGQPVGATAGPLSGGEFFHQGLQQTVPAVIAPTARPQRLQAVPLIDPCDPEGPQLSRSEWRSLLRQITPPEKQEKREVLPAPRRAAPCDQ